MTLKETLKRIFLRPEKKPDPPLTLEDLLEPETPVLGCIDPQFNPAPEPKQVISPKIIVPKTGIIDKIRASPLVIMAREKKVKIETGLTTRQRVKRYNASMEGGYGRPESARKK